MLDVFSDICYLCSKSVMICVYSYQLSVHEKIDTEAEGEEQLILLKQ